MYRMRIRSVFGCQPSRISNSRWTGKCLELLAGGQKRIAGQREMEMENGVEGDGGDLGWKMGELVEEMEGCRDDIVRQHGGVRALRSAACHGTAEPDGKFHLQVQGPVTRASGTSEPVVSGYRLRRELTGFSHKTTLRRRKADESLQV